MDLVMMGEDPEEEDHMSRMTRVREALKETLGEVYDQPVAGLGEADPSAGASTYRRNCEPCHGSSGQGDGILASGLAMAPADHTDAHHARYYSDAGRIEIIRNGIEGTPMPAFASQFSDAELLDLYAYVAGLRGDDPNAPEPGSDPASTPPAHDHSSHEH
jgi:high-affinity iron transporter